jgi:hypothetical protein
MPARSSVIAIALLVVVAGCGPVPAVGSRAPVVSPTGSATSSRPVATTSSAPTMESSPTPRVGAFPNPDGSVLISLPAAFGFAEPGDGGIWGILQSEGVGRDVVRIDPDTYKLEAVVRACRSDRTRLPRWSSTARSGSSVRPPAR